MARIRSIKPEYWTSEQVMECSRDARLLFIGMWNFCDDGGNHPASAVTLKAEVLPGDDVSTSTVMQWVDELIEKQLVAEYEVDGKEFWHVTGWHHQRIDQPTLRHPKGDTGHQGDARHLKRLGGKQRQLLIRKIRDRDGDACHRCGDTVGVSPIRVTDDFPGNPHDARNYRLFCVSCKRLSLSGDADVTQGDARYVAGDSPTESSRVESNGVEGSKDSGSVVVSGTPVTQQVTHVTDDDSKPKDAAEWLRHFRTKHGFEADPSSINDRKKLWPVFSAWTNAGLTTNFVDAAVAAAQARSKEPIACLPLYVDRLMASEQASRANPQLNARDESRRRAADVLTRVTVTSNSQPFAGEIVDGDAKLIG